MNAARRAYLWGSLKCRYVPITQLKISAFQKVPIYDNGAFTLMISLGNTRCVLPLLVRCVVCVKSNSFQKNAYTYICTYNLLLRVAFETAKRKSFLPFSHRELKMHVWIVDFFLTLAEFFESCKKIRYVMLTRHFPLFFATLC